MYPFCVVSDVEGYNQQRSSYSTSTHPTLVEVNGFMLRIANEIRSVANSSGYDIDNFHETSTTVALAITTTSFDVASATGLSVGNIIKVEGFASSVVAWEFTTIKTIVGTTVTVSDTLTYDAGANIYLVNVALDILRYLNAIGAAARAEESAFMGSAPNKSDHAETLWAQYYGSEEFKNGLWAIANLPGYLIGATTTDDAVENQTIQSYGSQHETDSDVDPVFEKDMNF